ncbi:class I SAM-dependent methyltransferase [Gordonia insulae]|nr:class I SAM-dependent methyltransferase [Gordonia insulae]
MATRWDETGAPRGDAYDERWTAMAAAGQNVHGEADLVETLLAGLDGDSVLDAGCGTGRVAIELDRRGHRVVGVDADPAMLAAARRNAPHLSWVRADLADLADLAPHLSEVFDLAVLAGNVMIFVHPGTELAVLAQVTRRVRPNGLVVAGFQLTTDRISLDDYDAHAVHLGLEPVARWSTWDGRPYEGGTYAVSVHRRVR